MRVRVLDTGGADVSARAIGSVIQVYDDPLTRLRTGFRARVIRCLDDDCGTWEGVALRRYLVQPVGRGTEPTEITALDEREGDREVGT